MKLTKKQLEDRLSGVLRAINSAVNATVEINTQGGKRCLGEVIAKYAELADERNDLELADACIVLLTCLDQKTLDRVIKE